MTERRQHQHRTEKPDKQRHPKHGESSVKTDGAHQDNLAGMNQIGFTSPASVDPHALNHQQILYLQRTIGNHSLTRIMQRENAPATDTAAPVAPALTPEQVERRNLAQTVMNAIDQRGGLNVAVYLVNWNDDPKKYENDDEFKTQAVQYAKDHQSFGVSGDKLKQGVSMGMDKSVAERMTQVVEKANALLDEFPDLYKTKPSVKVETLSIFTHGEANILQAGAKQKKDGKDRTSWIGPATLAKGMADNLSFIATVNLFACNTTGTVKVGDNFATALQKQLESDLAAIHGFAMVDVWGHTTAAHTTYNSNLVGMSPDLFGNNTQGDIKEELSKRLVMTVIGATGVELDEKAQKKLAEKARSVISKTLIPVDITYVKGKDGKKEKKEHWRTGPTDPLNTYFREISSFGIDHVWSDLTAESDPTDYGFLGLSAEAQERMAKGIKEFRERFKPLVTEFEADAIKLMEAAAVPQAAP